jgi:thymidine kinase
MNAPVIAMGCMFSGKTSYLRSLVGWIQEECESAKIHKFRNAEDERPPRDHEGDKLTFKPLSSLKDAQTYVETLECNSNRHVVVIDEVHMFRDVEFLRPLMLTAAKRSVLLCMAGLDLRLSRVRHEWLKEVELMWMSDPGGFQVDVLLFMSDCEVCGEENTGVFTNRGDKKLEAEVDDSDWVGGLEKYVSVCPRCDQSVEESVSVE